MLFQVIGQRVERGLDAGFEIEIGGEVRLDGLEIGAAERIIREGGPVTEQRIEFGVPVLSKTPLIDRLFRNIGIGRNSTSLMLMVTPRIIILEEEEERLGIPSVAI